jgi:hypothetical protein
MMIRYCYYSFLFFLFGLNTYKDYKMFLSFRSFCFCNNFFAFLLWRELLQSKSCVIDFCGGQQPLCLGALDIAESRRFHAFNLSPDADWHHPRRTEETEKEEETNMTYGE